VQKINYGLIISDFDGTLVNHDGTITTENKQTITAYCENGGKFAISTGRLPGGILRRAQELGLQGAISCCQGSIILDIQSQEVLYSDSIPNDVSIQICEKLESMGLHVHAYDLWEYFCNKDDDALKLYERLTQTKANLITDKPLSQLIKETGLRSYKFLAMVDPKDSAALIEELLKETFEGCCVTKSGDYLVEVINAKNSKGTAAAFLSAYYNVPIEKTVCIGDQWNDIPMIKAAGLGVAVKNADDKLKAQADVVIDYTNEESAVAKVIQQYGFKE
jgi:Cof subfamily protein (haloacid dehalogenase superfamily)